MNNRDIWYLATCQVCTPVEPQPFTVEEERDRWAAAHYATTGHVVITVQVLGVPGRDATPPSMPPMSELPPNSARSVEIAGRDATDGGEPN